MYYTINKRSYWSGLRINVLVLFLAVSSASNIYSQQEIYKEFQAAIDKEINENMPGLLIHIESPDRNISWSGAAGFSDKDKQIKMEPDQSFRIASVTKTFVASTILRLWEDKKLALEDPISKFISTEHAEILTNGGYDVNKITIRHLLTHSSGLFDHAQTEEFMKIVFSESQHAWTRTEQISKATEWGKPVGGIGERFSYADTGYILLGEIIEKLTGKSMNDGIREELDLKKLGLKNTWIEGLRPAKKENRIHQYFNGIDTYSFNPSLDMYGGGGFLSTSSDLAIYFQKLFNNQVYRQESTLDTMLAPVHYREKPRLDYRKGMYMISINGMDVYTHTGFWGTQVIYIPSMNTSIAVNYSQVWNKRGPATVLSEIITLLQKK
ncbi:MAG: beta-lactamase family protein [Bacteroidetes bacterium]|nr:beta-lactamase family protein [Bacteroidota bacterium]